MKNLHEVTKKMNEYLRSVINTLQEAYDTFESMEETFWDIEYIVKDHDELEKLLAIEEVNAQRWMVNAEDQKALADNLRNRLTIAETDLGYMEEQIRFLKGLISDLLKIAHPVTEQDHEVVEKAEGVFLP